MDPVASYTAREVAPMLKSALQARIESLEATLEEVVDELASGDPDIPALRTFVEEALAADAEEEGDED